MLADTQVTTVDAPTSTWFTGTSHDQGLAVGHDRMANSVTMMMPPTICGALAEAMKASIESIIYPPSMEVQYIKQ